jgi:hypothetical protein
MSGVEVAAWLSFAMAIVLRVLCGRFVKRGSSKFAPDAEFHPPLAARWFGARAADFGALLGAALTVLAGGLLVFSYFR